MAFMEWDERFGIGILKVDEERKQLIQILNALFDGMKPQTWDEYLEGLLKELYEGLLRHARTEEDIFSRLDCPKKQENKVELFRIIEILKEFIQEYHEKKVGISIQILAFLSGWLKSHFLVFHHDYRAFLKEEKRLLAPAS